MLVFKHGVDAHLEPFSLVYLPSWLDVTASLQDPSLQYNFQIHCLQKDTDEELEILGLLSQIYN